MRLAVAMPFESAYSQTFVAAHVAALPGVVGTLVGCPVEVKRSKAGAGRAGVREVIGKVLRNIGWVSAEGQRVRDLVRWLRGNRVSVVLAEFGPTAVDMVDACREAGVPLVAHFHGHDASEKSCLARYRDGYRRLFAMAAGVVGVSWPMVAALEELGAPRDRLHRIPYGVNLQRFTCAQPGAQAPHFVAVGRFVEKKAPQLTLLAFAKLAAQFPEARLTMAGEGPLLEPCIEMARALKLADRITFAGVLTHEAVATLMQTARAFVQHSLCPGNGDAEGTPVAILEASASGLPVIATRHAGIPEAVLDGVTGCLVAERDIEAMAAQMQSLLLQPALADELGRRGRAHVAEHYESGQQARKLADILESAAAGGARQ